MSDESDRKDEDIKVRQPAASRYVVIEFLK